MTDHLTQLKNILDAESLGYTVTTNNFVAKAPSIQVTFDHPTQKSYSYRDKLYRLYIKATSMANRETIVNTLLKLDMKHPSKLYNYDYYANEADDYTPPDNFRVVQEDLSTGVMTNTASQIPRLGKGLISDTPYNFRTIVEFQNITLESLVSSTLSIIPIQTLDKVVSITITPITAPVYASLGTSFEESDLTYGTPVTLLSQTWEDGSVLTATLTDVITTTNVFEIKGDYASEQTIEQLWFDSYSLSGFNISGRYSNAFYVFNNPNVGFAIAQFPAITSLISFTRLQVRITPNNTIGNSTAIINAKMYSNCLNNTITRFISGDYRNTLGTLLNSDTFTIPSNSWNSGIPITYDLDTTLLDGWTGTTFALVFDTNTTFVAGDTLSASKVELIIEGNLTSDTSDTVATFETITLSTVDYRLQTDYPNHLEAIIDQEYDKEAEILLKARWNL